MNIIRWYNQNRKQLFIVIFIVAAIILAIHFVNYLVKKDNEKDLNSGKISSSTNSSTTTYKPQQSAISSSTVSDKRYKEESSVIDDFMKYCNEGNTNEAYNLLSEDCKTVVFPTLEYFVNNYYKEIFKETKLYTIKNWIGSTYKVSITENMLATGKTNNGVAIEDYYTIVEENGSNKLNINSFIRRTKSDKRGSNNAVEVETIYIDTYMDYVIYTLKASNKTDKTILLDSGENTQNMYLLDKNNVRHTSYRNEIPSAELKMLPYATNTLQIKYASAYVTNREISYLVFNDIILKYKKYEDFILKIIYINRETVKIEL